MHRLMGQVADLGLLIGIYLVTDRKTKIQAVD